MNATTFEKATLYEQYRLPYAQEMVDGLLSHIGAVEVVADIGSGTGQLARMFASRSSKVYAVEPDSAMRKVAVTSLASLLNVAVIDGCAERTTLAENGVDLIVAGNAFHRFKPEACKEEGRVRMLGRHLPGSDAERTFGHDSPYDFQVQPHSVVEDATDVFEACQKLGWQNIACTPFGRGWPWIASQMLRVAPAMRDSEPMWRI